MLRFDSGLIYVCFFVNDEGSLFYKFFIIIFNIKKNILSNSIRKEDFFFKNIKILIFFKMRSFKIGKNLNLIFIKIIVDREL